MGLIKERKQFYGLFSGFARSVLKFPSRPALDVDDQVISYGGLGQLVSNIATTIRESGESSKQLGAILASRSLSAYAGILGILATGKGYVPLNPRFPINRTEKMFSISESDVIVVGRECYKQLEHLLPRVTQPITIIMPEVGNSGPLARCFPIHRFIGSDELSHGPAVPEIPEVSPDTVAYMLFTSGSTGEPKVVPVSEENATSYIRYFRERHSVDERDRFSQNHDLTFDFSVHDLFVCWESGACLCCTPRTSLMAPAKFIREKRLSMWASVPSVVTFLSRMRLLKPGTFPTIRVSMFCGEPLTDTSAKLWQEAAPNSIVENYYGPTEATVAITHYEWDREKSPAQCVNGVVPVGYVFEGQRTCIIDKNGDIAANGEAGELCLSGSQVVKGYFGDDERNRAQFIRLPSLGDMVWYRTGDLMRQDEDGCLYYLGRIDDQVQIHGHRVELQEIDFELRRATGSQLAVSIPWPIQDGSPEGIVAFVCDSETPDESVVLGRCREVLPEYMVPSKVYFVDAMPLNANGKIDRLQLAERLRRSE